MIIILGTFNLPLNHGFRTAGNKKGDLLSFTIRQDIKEWVFKKGWYFRIEYFWSWKKQIYIYWMYGEISKSYVMSVTIVVVGACSLTKQYYTSNPITLPDFSS